eukprot:TRINITY_DN3251_c0_g1_i1.p1 TRINITY_DN3251_c0_g1~~TRINITY_DN3251_c0_g1_i1.p1  ORF type:complete len:317 (-),score=63.26 TRINITY_DN3251_c0_g1_i1:246-1196(-)
MVLGIRRFFPLILLGTLAFTLLFGLIAIGTNDWAREYGTEIKSSEVKKGGDWDEYFKSIGLIRAELCPCKGGKSRDDANGDSHKGETCYFTSSSYDYIIGKYRDSKYKTATIDSESYPIDSKAECASKKDNESYQTMLRNWAYAFSASFMFAFSCLGMVVPAVYFSAQQTWGASPKTPLTPMILVIVSGGFSFIIMILAAGAIPHGELKIAYLSGGACTEMKIKFDYMQVGGSWGVYFVCMLGHIAAAVLAFLNHRKLRKEPADAYGKQPEDSEYTSRGSGTYPPQYAAAPEQGAAYPSHGEYAPAPQPGAYSPPQ